MSLATQAPPVEQGQLVQVRNRRYAVVEVIPARVAGTNVANERGQTLVRLASVEDDGIGEELSVIWEIEPGARVFSKGTLPEPTAFDSPERFDAFMNAVRWGVVSAARSRELQAPFRASVDMEDYQLEPLVRALQMPRVNLLIADDVGLGKTIEAGLVAHELLLRRRIRRILIVCPASLQVQWRDQMRDKFGLDYKIVDSNLLKDLRRTRGLRVNPWNHVPRLITSVDFLKRERPMRQFRDLLPGPHEDPFPRRFDLLIVDEAHNVAPPGTGRYATDSLRTQAVRELAPHFEHRLFLTATPHNGYKESFTALLELLDDQRFARGIDADQSQVRTVMIRRLKTEIVHPTTGAPRFPKRELTALEIQYSDAERKVHADLRQYAHLRRTTESPAERVAVEFVLKLLKKRLFSSPAAFASTLEKHVNAVGKPLGRQKRARRPVSESILQTYMDRLEEEFADDDELEDSTEEALDAAGAFFRELNKEEQSLLKSVQKYAADAGNRADSKAQRLLEWLKSELRPDGRWTERRVLIFTEYRATQKYLLQLFAGEGLLADERTLILHGGMDQDERERVKAAFQANPADSKVRILLATDAASEGIDLQNHCSRLIHYEIPWNPNRLEQRNGRLDRHGQKAPQVDVYHFVGAGYDSPTFERDGENLEADLEFLYRAARKVENIREDLGKVGSVIARQVSDAMLGKARRLDADERSPSNESVRKLLKWERDLRKQIEECAEQARETQHELRIYPREIQEVVEAGLELAAKPPLRPAELAGVWPSGERTESPVFAVPGALAGSWARARDGLLHPHTGKERPVTFDAGIARGRDDVVHAHLNHPLVRLSTNLLRAEIWSPVGEKKLNRIGGRRVRTGEAAHVSVLLYARLLILGSDQERLQEELIVAGGELVQGRFVRIRTQQQLVDLSRLESRVDISAQTKDIIREQWFVLGPGLENALDARVRERTKNLAAELERRREREIADITEVLTELQRRIEAELKRDEDPQLLLEFNDAEQKQYRRDRNHLEARLSVIPGEIQSEVQRIESRYANYDSRVFPVAVAIIVPEHLDR